MSLSGWALFVQHYSVTTYRGFLRRFVKLLILMNTIRLLNLAILLYRPTPNYIFCKNEAIDKIVNICLEMTNSYISFSISNLYVSMTWMVCFYCCDKYFISMTIVALLFSLLRWLAIYYAKRHKIESNKRPAKQITLLYEYKIFILHIYKQKYLV